MQGRQGSRPHPLWVGEQGRGRVPRGPGVAPQGWWGTVLFGGEGLAFRAPHSSSAGSIQFPAHHRVIRF